MRQADLLDVQKDGKIGKGRVGNDLPKEQQLRQDRLEKAKRACLPELAVALFSRI